MPATILRANARQLPLPDDSVDLVVTSPPYFALRSYQDGGEHYEGQIGSEPTPAEFVDALLEVTRECVRVLKPTGSLWVNLGDKYSATSSPGPQSQKSTMTGGRHKGVDHVLPRRLSPGAPPKSLIGIPWRYALRCIDDLGLILRAEVIWSKPNGLPESVTDRVRRSHEQWFHFTLNPRYFSAVDEIREEHLTTGRGKTWDERKAYGSFTGLPEVYARSSDVVGMDNAKAAHSLGKLPGSVWTVATEPLKVPDHLGVDHFAAFPTEWPKRIIRGWSAPGMTVLDPFGGTGTTALVASALGRHGISVDMSADYCRLAEWRTTDRNQRAKVLGVEKAEQQPAEQGALFDEGEVA